MAVLEADEAEAWYWNSTQMERRQSRKVHETVDTHTNNVAEQVENAVHMNADTEEDRHTDPRLPVSRPHRKRMSTGNVKHRHHSAVHTVAVVVAAYIVHIHDNIVVDHSIVVAAV